MVSVMADVDDSRQAGGVTGKPGVPVSLGGAGFACGRVLQFFPGFSRGPAGL